MRLINKIGAGSIRKVYLSDSLVEVTLADNKVCRYDRAGEVVPGAVSVPDGVIAVPNGVIVLPSGVIAIPEEVSVMPKATIKADELSVFADLCRDKWMKGRRKYKNRGQPLYQADTIKEIQSELLDLANYCAVLYWEFERLKGKKLP